MLSTSTTSVESYTITKTAYSTQFKNLKSWPARSALCTDFVCFLRNSGDAAEGHPGQQGEHVHPPEIYCGSGGTLGLRLSHPASDEISTNGSLQDVERSHILAGLEKTSWTSRVRAGPPQF